MCDTSHVSCQLNYEGDGNRALVSVQIPSTCMTGQKRGWILCPRFPCMTQAVGLKQVVSQLPFARPLSSCVWASCVISLVAWVCRMPPRNEFILEQTKAFLTEQQRIRTERRLAQLRQDQRQLELSEVLHLLSLIWLIGIVLFYARLYLGPQE